jgi:hypothetical protein
MTRSKMFDCGLELRRSLISFNDRMIAAVDGRRRFRLSSLSLR